MNQYEKSRLANGLRLVLVPLDSTQVVTAMIVFGVGSRYEDKEVAGIAHALEHMYFKGTKSRPSAFQISEFVDSIGGEQNAFTGKETTGFYVKVVPKHLKDALWHLSDMLQNSLLLEKDFDREKQVIVQEINMYEDLPMEVASNKFDEAIYGENALGRDIIGFKESVLSIGQEKLIDFKKNHYVGENGVLVIAGNLGAATSDQIKAMVSELFLFENISAQPRKEIEIAKKKAVKIVKKKTEQSHLVIGFRTIPLKHADVYKLDLLAMILGGSMSSRMFEEIREKRGLAYAVRTSASNFVESGALETQAGVPQEKIYEAAEAIMNEYRKIKGKKIPEAELQKAKEIITGKTLIKFEDSEELSHFYASNELLLNKTITPKEEIEIYQKITGDDILEVANKYFTDDRLGLSYVGPSLDKEKIDKILKI